MSRLGTEGAFVVLAKARRLEAEGKKIVHLEIGEPDFATPGQHRRGGHLGDAERLHALHARERDHGGAGGGRRFRHRAR